MKKTLIILLTLILVISSPLAASANSAEPPSFTVIMKSAPLNLEAEVISGNVEMIHRVDKFGESYFQLYLSHFYNDSGSPVGRRLNDDLEINFHNDVEESTFLIKLSDYGTYTGTLTFDFKTGEIHNGKLLSRTIFLIAVRVLLTLLIEGLVLFLFRFRQKRTWLIFILMNLITQGALNILLTKFAFEGYFAYALFFIGIIELFIFGFETLIFALTVKERKLWQRMIFVLSANIASWILGGILITYFPV